MTLHTNYGPRRLTLILLAFIPLVAYQNCGWNGDSFQSILSSDGRQLSVRWEADPDLQEKAMVIIENRCAACHAGGAFLGNIGPIDNVDYLLSSGLVVPGDSLSGQMMEAIQSEMMPPDLPLTQEERDDLTIWIDSFVPTSPLPQENQPGSGSGSIQATFQSINQNILIPKCLGCHNPSGIRSGEDFSTYQTTITTGKIVPGNAAGSIFYDQIASGAMPFGGQALSSEEVQAVADWINAGATQ